MSLATKRCITDASFIAGDVTLPLTVAMPVYNEQDAVILATADVQRNILDLIPGAELVVVDDGSKDNSGRILDDLAARDPRIRVIHQQNRGHGGALMAALSAARGDYVMLIDSDRQISLESFSTSWAEVQKGRDCVFGVRRQRHDPRLRLYLTKLVRFAIRLLFGIEIFDANVPYKLLRRSIWIDAQSYIPQDTLAPSLFLAIFAKVRGYDVAETEILHRERNTGVVSIRRLKLLKFSAKAFRQLLALRRRLQK
jgi:dolichol-phosphate mannosyltransferase